MNKLTQDQLDDLTAEMNNYMAETGRKYFPVAKAEELAALGAKRCNKCKEVKLIEFFPKNSHKRDGLNGQCKPCDNARGTDYYQRNTDKVLESCRDYRATNSERISEYYRTKRTTDEIFRLREQLSAGFYRAVRAGNTAEWVTPEQLLTYWAAKGIPSLECYLTGESLSPQSRSIDHVVAIANGGTHTVDNLMPATLEANLRKRNLSPDDALERLNQ